MLALLACCWLLLFALFASRCGRHACCRGPCRCSFGTETGLQSGRSTCCCPSIHALQRSAIHLYKQLTGRSRPLSAPSPLAPLARSPVPSRSQRTSPAKGPRLRVFSWNCGGLADAKYAELNHWLDKHGQSIDVALGGRSSGVAAAAGTRHWLGTTLRLNSRSFAGRHAMLSCARTTRQRPAAQHELHSLARRRAHKHNG